MSLPKRDQMTPAPRGEASQEHPAPPARTGDESLLRFFRDSPLAEAMAAGEIVLERDRDAIRDLIVEDGRWDDQVDWSVMIGKGIRAGKA